MAEALVEPVVFTNRAGQQLFGIKHTPAAVCRDDLAIILLSPGIKMRVGPNLLYRHMTDRFVEMGYTVFRFDFFGLGDSEGELSETRLADVYNHIEVGRYVDDTLDSMNFMQKEYGTQKFILGGLCGGAVTGLLAAGRDPRAVGLLGLGVTVVLASSAADPKKYLTQGQIKFSRQQYLKKLLSPASWLRFFTFKSDFRLIWISFAALFKKKKLAAPATGQPQGEPAPIPDDNRNPLIPKAAFPMLNRGDKILLVFSGADRLLDEYREKFEATYSQILPKYSAIYDVEVVKDANHVFSRRDWQNEMLDHSETWLRKHFPAGA